MKLTQPILMSSPFTALTRLMWQYHHVVRTIQEDADNSLKNTLPILKHVKSQLATSPHMDLFWEAAQEAFPPSISIPLLLTTLRISGMDKACDAISCNINLWVWAEACCVYV